MATVYTTTYKACIALCETSDRPVIRLAIGL